MSRKRLLVASTMLGLQFLVPASHAQTARNSAVSNVDVADTGRARSVTKNSAKQAAKTPADSGETIIVTGTHAFNRKAHQSTSPITVLSSAELKRSGELNLAQAISHTYPSIDIGTMGNDAGALTSAIRMRGLNPNEVLVLVDGKRRHTTANIYADAGPQFGSTPVDLNMIPASAIDHIEVLEDGAAAMYGSDAIAGVVNIITKKTAHGLTVNAQTGANAYNGDGWQYQLAADGGFSFGNDGYLHLSGEIYHADHFIPYTEDHRLLGSAPAGAGTSLYTGNVKVPAASNFVMSTPEETRESLAMDFGKTLTEGVEGYGQITYAHRHSESYENYRVPSTAPAYYPYGFSPLETIDENDYAATLGLKVDNFLGFSWDLSTTYGADEDDVGDKNTINAGMLSSSCIDRATHPNSTSAYASTDGCGTSPTTVEAESYRLAQWTNNLDFRRRFNVAHVLPMTLAFGAEHRLETYDITAGSPPSYEAGGTAGYVGLQPQSAGSWSRDVWAGYADADLHPLPHWDLDFAGRFEHYTDTGNTENGKVSTRYDITPRTAVRGTISNGFRAPTLAEQHFSSINVGATSVSGLLPVSSAAAQALGAAPLKPERSTNISGGFVFTPLDRMHVSVDAYQINIRDRIIAGGSVNGAAAENAIQQLGFVIPTGLDPNAVSTYYFANGASTRTQGLDVNADYLLHLRRWGNLTLTAALDLNRTTLTHVGSTLVGGVPISLLNAATSSYITSEYPRSKLILNAYWTIGSWDVNLRETRWGQTTAMLEYQDYTPSSAKCAIDGKALRYSNSCFAQFKNTPAWLTDLQVGYHFGSHWYAAIGANDIFNIRPRKIPAILDNYGARIYDANAAQISVNGGYYYGRITASF